MPLPHAALAPSTNLAQRVIFITGASGRLGREIALACARSGATVILHGRVVRKLESLYDEIVAAGHAQPTILPLDLITARAEDFDRVAASVRGQLGRLDALVHTAALLGSLGPMEHQPLEAWQKVFAVNVVAAAALTRASMPLLAAAPDASIVFTLDTRGQSPRAYWGAYAASKAALAALATTLADECERRDNVRVNAVVPGPMRSPLRMQSHPGEDRATLPDPASIAPLYVQLIGTQRKAESAIAIDAQAWLRQEPAATSLLPRSDS